MKKAITILSIILGLCLVFCGCSAVDRISSGAYTEGDIEITDEIYKIDIDWQLGGVMVRGSETAKGITVKENATDGAKLATRIIGSVLYIKAAAPGKEAGEKNLMVTVPADYNYKEIEIRTTGANAGLRNLKASRADIETESGSISVVNCVIDDEAELESSTGRITTAAEIADYDIETVSGSVEIRAATLPGDLDVETVDGTITATFPADTPAGSIKAKTEGAVVNSLTNKEKGARFNFNSETGSIFILAEINGK